LTSSNSAVAFVVPTAMPPAAMSVFVVVRICVPSTYRVIVDPSGELHGVPDVQGHRDSLRARLMDELLPANSLIWVAVGLRGRVVVSNSLKRA
jgi:hypothetical protein